MQRYDVATLSIRTATAAKALVGIDTFLAGPGSNGKLLAVWTAEIGTLNQIQVIRGYDDHGALAADRDRMLVDGDLFGANDFLTGLTLESFAPFPFIAPMPTGAFGPVYEVRVYGIKPGGIAPVIAAWREALPPRVKLSPILFAGYALDGATPRMLHICPYPSVNDRTRVRGEAVAAGIWPPKGGPDWLTTMQSTIFMPAKFSPLQ
jgi:hypothetical protein